MSVAASMRAQRRTIAIVKRPAPSLAERCELTFIEREAMSFATLQAQHRAYCDALTTAGAEVHILDADDALPDSVFVEDAAVVLDEIAILTRPGSASRLPEPARIEASLAPYRKIERIQAPATLDGGDVLRIGDTLYVGLTSRTNREGIDRLACIVEPLGDRVIPVPVAGSLHLKTACTALDARTLLANPAWIDLSPFAGMDTIHVDATEPFAANVLPIGEARIVNAAFPRTRERVAAHCARVGLRVVAVDIAEFGKAEAGLTCMSLVFAASGVDADDEVQATE